MTLNRKGLVIEVVSICGTNSPSSSQAMKDFGLASVESLAPSLRYRLNSAVGCRRFLPIANVEF